MRYDADMMQLLLRAVDWVAYGQVCVQRECRYLGIRKLRLFVVSAPFRGCHSLTRAFSSRANNKVNKRTLNHNESDTGQGWRSG